MLFAIVGTAALAGMAFWIAHKLGPLPGAPADSSSEPLPDKSPDPPHGPSD
ncbi:hypothetical protein [Nonomuraea angiospora]|uniref:hypothetical protein n=1 Tax=Nonomuraea angiospora TaxID=46172 RepID=UPI0029A0A8FF|nr:hypothetical protein [Nonomuraea angiospora]MDX3107847.1 hypothetical protein [Nonomuraea angiospora]